MHRPSDEQSDGLQRGISNDLCDEIKQLTEDVSNIDD